MYENRYYSNIQCIYLNNYREISRDNIFSDIGSTALLLKNVPQSNIKNNNNVQTWPIRRAAEVLLRVNYYTLYYRTPSLNALMCVHT